MNNSLATKIINLAKTIDLQNEEFGYVASVSEIANDVWYQLEAMERFEIMKSIETADKKELKDCLNIIANILEN